MKSLLSLTLLGALVMSGCGAPARPASTAFDAYESAEQPGWLQVDSGPGRFSVLLPATALRRASSGWQQTRTNSLGRSFAVSYRDEPTLSQGKNQRGWYDRRTASYVAEAAETRTNEPFAAFDEVGRKLIFRNRESNRWVSVRMLVVGARFYELTVYGAPGEPLPEADAALFFGSFEPVR